MTKGEFSHQRGRHVEIASVANLGQETAPGRRMFSVAARLRAESLPVVVVGADGTASSRVPKLLSANMGNDRPVAVRSLAELGYFIWLLGRFVLRRPSHVLLSAPPIPILFIALVPRWVTGIGSLVLDIRDLTFDYLRGANSHRVARAVARITEWAAVRALNRADAVTCTTSKQAEELALRGVRVVPTTVRNGLATELAADLRMVASVPSLSQMDGRRRYLYAGTLGYAQDPVQLLEIARLDPECRLTFIGSGPLEGELRAAAAGLNNVEVLPPVGFHDLLQLYCASDVLIACLRSGPEFQTPVPSKLYEYAATGRMLIFVGDGEASEVTRSLGGIATSVVDRGLLVQISEAALQRADCNPDETSGIQIPTRDDSARQLIALLLGQ